MSLGSEIVYLREPWAEVPVSSKWKVTARYTVQVRPNVLVRCVRVRTFLGGQNLVRHFSEEEFRRLFR